VATTYDDIYSRYSMKTTDYTLDKMYMTDEDSYKSYLKGFLMSSIALFTQCAKDLTDRNDTTNTFNVTLTDLEQEILSCLMVVEWCSKQTHNLKELERTLGDTDFKLYSESQNLKAKSKLLVETREVTDKLMTQYGYAVVDLSDT